MPISAKCRCGRGLKVRDSAAGKRVKCPDCGKPVRIPAPATEDYEDDLYSGGHDMGVRAPRVSKKKKKKTRGKPESSSKLSIVAVGGGVLVGVSILLGGIYYLFFSGSDDGGASDVAVRPPAAGAPNTSMAEAQHPRDDLADASSDAERSSSSSSSAAVATQPPTGGTDQPADAAMSDGKVITLSNARFERSSTGANSLVVDFVKNGMIPPGNGDVIYLVVPGTPIIQNVGFKLFSNSGRFAVPLPPGSKLPNGNLQVLIESRPSPQSREGAVILSNAVPVQ